MKKEFHDYCSTTQKSHSLRVSPFLIIFFFVRLRRNQSRNLVFTTTVVEDTHLTLAGIPFKVEATNSLIFLLLQTYEKKFAEFFESCSVNKSFLSSYSTLVSYLLFRYVGEKTPNLSTVDCR